MFGPKGPKSRRPGGPPRDTPPPRSGGVMETMIIEAQPRRRANSRHPRQDDYALTNGVLQLADLVGGVGPLTRDENFRAHGADKCPPRLLDVLQGHQPDASLVRNHAYTLVLWDCRSVRAFAHPNLRV